MLDREKKQVHVEELFAESSRAYEEQRRRQRALDWLDYHQRKQVALENTLGALIDRYLNEQARYRARLNTPTKAEVHG
jgi:hypothetical protein